LESKGDIFRYNAKQLMTRNAKSIGADCLAAEAVAMMEQHSITCLFVLHDNGKPMGVIHLHDLLKAGL
jgi:arabinose-5-phosphate isomerase